MDIHEAIAARHSVRKYTDQVIGEELRAILRRETEAVNQESGLNIQLCFDEPKAYSSLLAKFGTFRNVRNYIALVGKEGPQLEEQCGYFGEKLVLHAQMLGLNTCWTALTYSKTKCAAVVNEGEKLAIAIALGYGQTQGTGHKMKPLDVLGGVAGKAEQPLPEWFRKGLEAAQLAPTALNQQKFRFELEGDDKVRALPGKGFYTRLDLGIAKYHFEVGAQNPEWSWAE